MIYFLGCPTTNSVKIGTTVRDVAYRVALISSNSPVPLQLIAVIDGDRTLEQALHAEFSEHRLHNEWFKLEGGLRLFLRRLLVDGPASVSEYLAELRARAGAQHGTISVYIGRECRCSACVDAWRTYQQERRSKRASAGRWVPGGRGRPPKNAYKKAATE